MNLAGSSITCGIEMPMASNTRIRNSIMNLFKFGSLLSFLGGNTLKICKIMPNPKLIKKAIEILSKVKYSSRVATVSKKVSSMMLPRQYE